MTSPDPVVDWLTGTAVEQLSLIYGRLDALENQQTMSAVATAALAGKIYTLETTVATTDEQINAVKANLTNITSDVSRLTAEIERVKGELEQVDPKLAAKLQPLVDQSKAIADATPEPAPTPTPPAA